MKMQSLYVKVATLGPVGYVQGSGTLATLLTLPAVYFLQPLLFSQMFGLLMLLFLGTTAVVSQALTAFPNQKDPSAIVVDEVIGCLITFCAVPISTKSLVIGFGLFRLFDIFKPLGIARVERCKGFWGIMLDDCIAGIFSNFILHLLLML